MEEGVTQAAREFLKKYKSFLEADSSKKARKPLAGMRKLLDRDVTISYSGEPGLVSKAYGSFQGKDKGVQAMLDFRRDIKTDKFKAQEFVNTSFDVDFTNQANPLTPAPNKVAVIAEQESSANGTGRDFRLDNVIYFESNNAGKLSRVTFGYDAYLMSEAIVGRGKQVPNPDIEDTITGRRDKAITSEETLGAALRFFAAFGGVQSVKDLNTLAPFLQPNAAVKFGGDPKILPFADKKIREGAKAVIATFKDQLRDSAPREFDIQEIYVKHDRFLANTFEARTAVDTGRFYDLPVSIVMTASRDNGGRVSSIEGIFDSQKTVTAFTGSFPFINAPV